MALTAQQIETGLHNLNASYGVIDPKWNDNKFTFFYGDEVHNPIGKGRFTSTPNANMKITEGDCWGEFFTDKYEPGEYVDYLFQQLDKSVI